MADEGPRLSPNLVLFIAVGFTALSLLVAIGIAVTGATNDASKNLLDTCSSTWRMGFGAIIGLTGRRLG